ncbi:hypothetical protein WN944_011013 [Citrus x changshan-huyou]|uniref:Partial AB-hydrolase lipase domain-containing protein n=1 Tax=Citrus x changshan-huyou TaxID=2935761 RepID=A0AAP0MZ28_9ROSI
MAAFAAAAADGVCKTMVKPQGYALTTQDGYILSMQRISVGRSAGAPGKRPPVLLPRGLLGAYWNWSRDELASSELPALSERHQLLDMWKSASLLSPCAVELVMGICPKVGMDCIDLLSAFGGSVHVTDFAS